MSDMKHTPGPWSVGHVRKKNSLRDWNDIAVHVGAYGDPGGGPGNAIAIVHMGGSGAISNEVDDLKANASLISAAPDLLAILAEITDHAEKYGAAPFSATKMFDRARAAIAKAKGV